MDLAGQPSIGQVVRAASPTIEENLRKKTRQAQPEQVGRSASAASDVFDVQSDLLTQGTQTMMYEFMNALQSKDADTLRRLVRDAARELRATATSCGR